MHGAFSATAELLVSTRLHTGLSNKQVTEHKNLRMASYVRLTETMS